MIFVCQRLVGWRELKVACDNTADCKVFVEFFPAKGYPAKLDRHPPKLGIRGILETAKTLGWKAEYSAIVQLHKNHPSIHPYAKGQGFLGWISDCGETHGRP